MWSFSLFISFSSSSPIPTADPTARRSSPLLASSSSYLQLLRSSLSSSYWWIEESRKLFAGHPFSPIWFPRLMVLWLLICFLGREERNHLQRRLKRGDSWLLRRWLSRWPLHLLGHAPITTTWSSFCWSETAVRPLRLFFVYHGVDDVFMCFFYPLFIWKVRSFLSFSP